MNINSQTLHKLVEVLSSFYLHRAVNEVTNERGIVISRSTYPSSGTMTGHWLGDNDSSWAHMRDSVIGKSDTFRIGVTCKIRPLLNCTVIYIYIKLIIMDNNLVK